MTTTSGNGEKSKIIYFLLGLLQTILLGWLWWTGAGVVEAKEDIATLKANYGNIMTELTEIKGMLKHK